MLKIMFSGLALSLFLLYEVGGWYVLGWLVLYLFALLLCAPYTESVKLADSWVLIDVMSYSFVLLSMFLFILMYLGSGWVINKNLHSRAYNLLLLLLLGFLLGSFFSSNYLLFYIFFEASLIPTLLIILGWGYQPERLQAGLYFVMYTLLASLPFLVCLVIVSLENAGMFMFDGLMLSHLEFVPSKFVSYTFFVGMVLAFLVKFPMFLVHLWLPKAHVEAPTVGSMVLAGILLKLGGYGLMRVMKKIYFLSLKVSHIYTSTSLVGMVVIGLICCRLNDLKSLVAYSSVAHMGFVICAIFSSTVWGLNSGLIMMVGHGLSSSGLFCFVSMMYERVGSRSMYISKGVITALPVFSLLFFLLCCSNISAPPSINLLSEISLMVSVFYYEKFSLMLFGAGTFLGAVFTFYMFSLSQHGKYYLAVNSLMKVNFLEFHALLMHIMPINLLILKNSMFFNFM